jgi:sporulation protein YlmC with PRC-barrel domain/ribosomal protein L40E
MSSPKYYRNGELQGKTVIETTGNRLGKAKEIALSLDGSTMLFVEKDDGSEVQFQTSKLIAIGEFIVVRSEAVPVPPVPSAVPSPSPAPTMAPAAATPTMVCASCGAPLKPGARFCTKCGSRVL